MRSNPIIQKLFSQDIDAARTEAATNLSANPTVENWFIMGLVKMCSGDLDYAMMCFSKCEGMRDATVGYAAAMAAQEGSMNSCNLLLALLMGASINFTGFEA